MVRHIIVWTLKDTFSEEEKAEVKRGIKEGLEGLEGKIPGLVEIRVITEGLASSTADLMLDSTFTDEATYKGYKTHPAHVAVANGKVRPNVDIRLCMDFEA
ncbi:MAG: Dabb family protein [Lachnospiraceae bacterium]|nr:Dabb family protein [Lachnospiraceae bacterium]